VSKKYDIPGQKQPFYALKNIDLKIKKGDNIGIIGPNGTGKTTLLKIIGGITKPSSGKISIKENVVSLSHLEAGFHPELTGFENIISSGLLAGMTKKKIISKTNTIIYKSKLGKFIHAPFYTYSSGMKFRLAFSIASINLNSIILIDEIITTADLNFQKQIINLIKEIQLNQQVTLITASCSPMHIWQGSQKHYYLNKNKLKLLSKKWLIKLIIQQEKMWEEIFPLLKEIKPIKAKFLKRL